MIIVMLGAPGAGKGTQAALICEQYHIPHISTGDLFRANIKNGTELGKKVSSYMAAGGLVPDELTIQLLLDRVAADDCERGYVLDGFPRTIPQAQVLTDALKQQGAKVDYAINVDVPDENIVRRMSGRRNCPKCGASYHIQYIPPKQEGVCDVCGAALVQREDDRPETVQNRLAVYHQQTMSLIDYYRAEGVLCTVDGTKDKNDVFADIVALLG